MSFVKATYGLQLALYFEDFLFRWAGWGQLPLKRELHLLDDMSTTAPSCHQNVEFGDDNALGRMQ